MSKPDSLTKQFMQDPAAMSDEEIARMKTDLRNVFSYIKYAGDKDKLQNLVETDSDFRHLKRSVAELLNAVTQSKLALPEGEEEIDMCKALQDIRAEAITIGTTKGRLDALLELVRDGIITVKQAAANAKMTEAQFLEKLAETGSLPS